MSFWDSTNYKLMFEKLIDDEFVFESIYPSEMNITACQSFASSHAGMTLEFFDALSGLTKWAALRAHTETHRYTIFNLEDMDYIKSIIKRKDSAE